MSEGEDASVHDEMTDAERGRAFLEDALDELAQAGLTRTWGGSAGVYVDLLWLDP